MSSSDGEDLDLDSMFPEPPRPPTPDPTIAVYKRHENDDDEVKIRLVGSHSLWGHYLWNSAICLASQFDENPEKWCRNRSALELGAGGGLPSIIAALNGAKKVVITDYPDTALVENIQFNVNENISDEKTRQNVSLKGYIWGTPVKPLLDLLPAESKGYDLMILSDLVFNHSQHDALLRTCEQALRPSNTEDSSDEACILVFYTHHRPHLAHRDMMFFEKAREQGWTCEEIVEKRYPPMFPDDPGAEEVRATVHGWKLTRNTTTAT